MSAAESLFASSYHDARACFLQALDAFEARTGRRFERQRYSVDANRDLSIDVAELRPAQPDKLYVAVSGIHGIEGYAGNAIQRALLGELLARLDLGSTGLLLVHALNPVGMQRLRRVNASNVDLNRNFALEGSALYATDSSRYSWLASVLGPTRPYDGGLLTRVSFLTQLALRVRRHGYAALRQATLAGQYTLPAGIFYGGAAPEPETRFFQRVFAETCVRYREILLTDLHTGYGERARAYPLFARADSPQMQEFGAEGVRDARGRNQSYTAHGDLVGYAYETTKAKNPQAVCNAVVVELGTHGLGALAQLEDLHTVVRENQVYHHGSRTPAIRTRVQRRFCELFNPSDAAWQQQALNAALERIETLLVRRGFLAAPERKRLVKDDG